MQITCVGSLKWINSAEDMCEVQSERQTGCSTSKSERGADASSQRLEKSKDPVEWRHGPRFLLLMIFTKSQVRDHSC